MAFENLIKSADVELCEGLSVYLVEPTLADSRVIAKLSGQHDEIDYGLLASACIIDRFEGAHAPTVDEWPPLSDESVLVRARTLQTLPARLSNRIVLEVNRLLGLDSSDQD